MIQLENLNKYYAVGRNKFHALININMQINNGDMLCIKGKSGAGKSTLLHILGGLDKCDSGTYVFDGVVMSNINDKQMSGIRNEKIGFVLQDFALINDQTVIFNTMLPMFFNKSSYAQMKERAMLVLDQVGIADQAKKKVNQLSGGQKQRVAIARAMINSPELLLADEPTGALDSSTSKEIMELLSELNQSGITVVIVSHDSIVSEYCNKTIEISDGKILEEVFA